TGGGGVRVPGFERLERSMTGRPAVRSTIEQALRLDLDQLLRRGVVRPGEHLAGDLRLEFFDDDLVVEFESRTWDTGGWLRLQYAIPDYQTGEPIEIDDQVRLTATTQPNIGGGRDLGSWPPPTQGVRQH